MKPKIKQKEAFVKIMENHGNVSRAMREVGYSPNTAKNPKTLTDSKGWQILMDEYFPDDELAKVEKEGLSATRVISAVNTGKEATGGTTDFIDVPDYAVRHKYLETALKLKKRLTDRMDVTSGDKSIVPIYGGKSTRTEEV